MGDSACVMHSFSHAAVMPHESNQMSPMHTLGDSISFGRYMTESLSWEKWSSFSSHKKYVEEAESYARKGSVAQKKAFFEAHYKRIAAQKAAALLEQENAEKAQAEEEEQVCDENNDSDQQRDFLSEDDVENNEADNLENKETVSASKSNRNSLQIERRTRKSSEKTPSATSKNSLDLSSMVEQKTWEFPSSPFKEETNVTKSRRKSSLDSTGQRRPSSNSLRTVLNLVSLKEHEKEPVIMVSATTIEEKFNAKEVQKIQKKKTFKEKAGNKLRKLGCGLFFKARPLPDFHKESEITKHEMKKTPAAKAQPTVLGRSVSSNKQSTISMPPPPPPPSLPNKSAFNNSSQKNVPRKSLTHENASPNIQQ